MASNKKVFGKGGEIIRKTGVSVLRSECFARRNVISREVSFPVVTSILPGMLLGFP